MPLSNAERQLRFRQRQRERRAAAIDLFDVEFKLEAIIARYEALLPNWRTARGSLIALHREEEPGVLERMRDVLHYADDARKAMRPLLNALVELNDMAPAARFVPEQPGEPS